jgi:hypothetical protein
MVVYSSTKFIFSPSSKTISCEYNDITEGKRGMLFEVFTMTDKQLPLTWGIIIESARTGHYAKFQFVKDSRDAYGDITCWELKPTVATIMNEPQLDGWTLVIFND